MEYNKSAIAGIRPSRLGFGMMRLPVAKGGGIDEDLACRMIAQAIGGGVNYFDTAYLYMDGKSEDFVGRTLSAYSRESYYLTTKLPTTKVKTLEEAKAIYAEQRKHLRTDYYDFYLLHNVNLKRYKLMKEIGAVDWLLEEQAKGGFLRFGFSFHGSYPELEEILTDRKWDVCQIQLNYMDTEEQSGIRGYELTEKLGIPVIIMEPVKGGALANPPAPVREVLQSMDPEASPSSWALRWAASLPNVMTVLSGMSAPEHVADNLRTFSPLKPLSSREKEMLDKAAQTYRGLMRNQCTGCRYCMPCPSGVNIPLVFKLWNEYGMFGKDGLAWKQWRKITPPRRPENCVQCGQCEAACPQQISVIEDLKAAAKEMDRL